MEKLKDKIILIASGSLIIFIVISAYLILNYTFMPIKRFLYFNNRFVPSVERLNGDISRIKKAVNPIKYYQSVKSKNYKKSVKKALAGLKVFINKIDSDYKGLFNLMKMEKMNTGYKLGLKNEINKKYFEWKNINRPILMVIYRHYSYISPRISLVYFYKYALAMSSVSVAKITKKMLSTSEHLIDIAILVFITGIALIMAFWILATYYLGKYVNSVKIIKKRFEDMFSYNPAICFVLDIESGKIVDANRAAEKFYGYTKKELTSMNIGDINVFTEPGIQQQFRLNASGSGLSDVAIFKHKLKNGEVRTIEAKASEILMSGKKYLFDIITDITEAILLKKQVEEDKAYFEKLSVTDFLTGIFNRRKFESSLEEYVKLSKRYDKVFSLAIFDIDYFKNINDTYGHPTGDNVLTELAGLVKANIRETDIFARFGGDEFIILMPETNLVKAAIKAGDLRKLIEQNTFKYVDSLTCSFGVVEYNIARYCEDLDDCSSITPSILKSADKVLYRAKQRGRNNIETARF